MTFIKGILTYCISTHNNLEYLKLCVESVRQNAFNKLAPIYIYAEGCSDGTNEWLHSLQDGNIKFWIYPEKWNIKYWGIGGGMNFLAEQVKTHYIIFLHSDMVVSANFDKRLIELLEKENYDIVSSYRMEPDIFTKSVSEIQHLRPGTLIAPLEIFGHTHHNFLKNSFFQFAEDFVQQEEILIRKGEGAGGFIISKKAWDFIGGNDPLFAPKSYEDMDLFIRMQLAGYKFIQTTKSLIWHFGARSSHFPTDDFTHSSDLQLKCERENRIKWLQKWNTFPEIDNIGFVSSNNMKLK